MSNVWDHSKMKGSTLLLLIAIADNANDDGLAWPGIETLAKKTRQTERTISNQIGKCEQSGELMVYRRDGLHNHYIVTVNQTEQQTANAISMLASRVKESVTDITTELFAPLKKIQHPPEKDSADPSLNRNAIDKSIVPGGKSDDFKPLQKLVVEYLFEGNWSNASWAGRLTNVLLGRSDVGEFAESNITPPVTPDEFERFCRWYSAKKLEWPTTPSKLNQQVFNFRKEGQNSSNPYQLPPEPEQEYIPPAVMPTPRFNADGTPISVSV